MKTLRLILALGFASALCGVVYAADKDCKDKGMDCKDAAKTCDCAKDKDGKACGKDKDCCCTGKKAEKKADDAAKDDQPKKS